MHFKFFVIGAVVCIMTYNYNEAFTAVNIQAGEPGKIVLTIEAQVQAGEPFLAKIEVRDVHDNLIVNYPQMGRAIKLTTTGKGKLSPDVIAPSEFIGGVAKLSLTYNKSEAITITATEEVSGKQSELKVVVRHGKVNYFLVEAPSTVIAGQNFHLRIESYDAYGNLVTNYNSQNKGVEIAIRTGKISPNIIPSSIFTNGIASVEVMCAKTQSSAISVMDIIESAYGKSATVKVEPSEAKRFLVSVPVNAVAGDIFTVRIEAYDAFDNLVANYDKVGRGILITPQGQGRIRPNEIPASVFVNGIATVSLTYDRAEPLGLLITEKPGQLPVARPEEVTPAGEKPKEEAVDPKVEAKACYERAVEAINLNKYEEAKKELEKCIALDPGHTEAKKLLDRLNIIIKLETK